MNSELKTVSINKTDITVKEYLGKRVVTLKEIDACHNRPEGTAGRNFRTNKQHFIEGTDFFRITPDEFRRTIGEMDNRQQNDVTLITESGYLMLVKSFTDDLAWDVQRQLVNTYFRVEQNTADNNLKLQIQQERSKAMMLNAKSRTAKQMMELWTAAGVEPQYQALALNDYYDGLALPRTAFKEKATELYDATTIAEHLGIMSKSNKPHAQAVTAIISVLDIDESEKALTPYSRNGHDGESIQYALSVEHKVSEWLTENNYPTVISFNNKNYTVKYRR